MGTSPSRIFDVEIRVNNKGDNVHFSRLKREEGFKEEIRDVKEEFPHEIFLMVKEVLVGKDDEESPWFTELQTI